MLQKYSERFHHIKTAVFLNDRTLSLGKIYDTLKQKCDKRKGDHYASF